ncbi:hypothetical protein PR202_gb06600 [Eleusine coracana subsp. coracana]|uniref:Protein kinase domain-containing protein n=1 Tax=Eleusine coracana subsp. coracana TaxID=191504 RepID=A0AAV5E7J7_ELECO|nr:hypothetical protein PR202_gb06600 [Eleusine coracana subsp. coracana]
MVLLLLAFICLFALVASTHSALISNAEIATSNASDHLALLSFKSHIRTDPSQALESWGNRSIPMCQWRGVTCGRRGRPHGRVMALDLENLSLLGAISSSVANLTFLTTLHLPSNHLHGAVSSVLGRLLYLKHVDLSGNFLNSKIPPSLSQCKRLESISLEFNSLQGEIPRELGSLHNAKLLNLGHNKLTGAIPLEISNLVSLEFLHIGRNKLTGEIPAGIDLQHNRLTGGIPESLGNLNLLQSLALSFNNLTGKIPSSVGNLSINLKILDMGANNITGKIPEEILNLVSLETLALDVNNLEGTIPNSLGKLNGLNWLDLSSNNLIGPIPPSIGNLTKLSILHLYGNMLNRSIPSSLLGCPLQRLDLSNNRIVGSIPRELFLINTLSDYVQIQNNMLTGTLPIELGNLKNLGMLDFSRNQISGEIPASLGDCQMLQYLNASHNNLEGKILLSVEQMKGLLVIDLSYNNLSGNIPKFLANMRGNDGLCGGIPQLKLSPCSSYTTKKLSLKIAIAISVGSTCLFVILTMFAFFTWKKKAKANQHIPTISDQHVVVAVKVLNLLQRGASQSFAAECETLRCARHRNLVKIITACSSVDNTGTDFKALIFEFLPNGNLEQWLHQPIFRDGEYNAFDLVRSLDISIDVASALEYLHQNKPLPIIHCDLKPSNILLDHDMVAHVGDVGLARFYHEDPNVTSEKSSAWVKMRGTTGYVAPVDTDNGRTGGGEDTTSNMDYMTTSTLRRRLPPRMEKARAKKGMVDLHGGRRLHWQPRVIPAMVFVVAEAYNRVLTGVGRDPAGRGAHWRRKRSPTGAQGAGHRAATTIVAVEAIGPWAWALETVEHVIYETQKNLSTR